MNVLYELAGIMDAAKKEYEKLEKGATPFDRGQIFCGDNLSFLADHCLARENKIDLIYIDPPFFSGANYKARIETEEGIENPLAYTDKWGSLSEFLQGMALRLMLMKDALADTGLIAVHLDPRASHYIKIIMDEIFGQARFVNELIWSYKSGGASIKSFARKHDTILLYSKTGKYYFKPQKERSYNRGGKPYRFKGVDEYKDEDGHWYTLVNQKDVLSIDMVGRTSSERTGYATQKPVKLLELLINSCCPENGICADFFCGSGSLGDAAKRLGRDYVLCDKSSLAIEISRRRLYSEKQLSIEDI